MPIQQQAATKTPDRFRASLTWRVDKLPFDPGATVFHQGNQVWEGLDAADIQMVQEELMAVFAKIGQKKIADKRAKGAL